MLKLRLATAAAFLALLAGCPTEGDDLRRARGEAAEPVKAEVSETDFACGNLRPWREDLDVPQFLKEGPENDEGRRRRLERYIDDHKGTFLICRNKLQLDGDRGTCSVCTEMLDEKKFPKYTPTRLDLSGPVVLNDEQKLVKKVEFRTKYDKANDYLTEAKAQEEALREWLTKRGAEPAYVDKVIELERVKGTFTKDPNVPKYILKYGLPPLAEPFVRCPNKDCKTRETTSVNPLESRCWNCDTYFTVTPRDERLSNTEPLEVLCPFCKNPVDPTLNFCSKCNKFLRNADREGPCWRCGGTHICPECGGSGKGNSPIYGNEDCWLCGGKSGTNPGSCPECDSKGFTVYEGALPNAFNPLARKNDDYRLFKGAPTGAAPAKKSGGEEGGGDEK